MAESLSIVVYCGVMVLPFSSRSSSVEGVVVVSAKWGVEEERWMPVFMYASLS